MAKTPAMQEQIGVWLAYVPELRCSFGIHPWLKPMWVVNKTALASDPIQAKGCGSR
jgi:hypothetical protein